MSDDYHNQHDDADKPRLAKVLKQFPRALRGVATVGMYGAHKYTWDGWFSTPDLIERYEDSMMRHALPVDGKYDESEVLHMAHLVWDGLAVLEQMIKEGVPLRCEPSLSIQKPLESTSKEKLDPSTLAHVTTTEELSRGDLKSIHSQETYDALATEGMRLLHISEGLV